jgi:CRP/FNR family transcriptional regulator, cyclic AMP receptor protein
MLSNAGQEDVIGKVSRSSPKIKVVFDPEYFLANMGDGRSVLRFSPRDTIFVQGKDCDAIFYIRAGKVKITVLAKTGKEATIGILNPGAFFGEGGIAGQPHRMSSATAVTDCSVTRITNKTMQHVLHKEQALSDMFVAYQLSRTLRYEEGVVDLLFNSSEKRLARMLLLLAQFGNEGQKAQAIANMSQETLADMVGTTRSRVSFFMNRFRKLGCIDYNSASIEVHGSLLTMVLHD